MGIKDYLYRHPEWIFYILGIPLIIFGCIYAIWIWLWFSLGWASILISLGTALIAWGIHRKTGVIITDIADISTKTEETTEKIAKSSLSETIGVFEDKRLGLRERWGIFNQKAIIIPGYRNRSNEFLIDFTEYRYYSSFLIWKCRTYIKRAMLFKDSFKLNDEEDIIHHVDCLFQDLCRGILIIQRDFGVTFHLKPEYHRHLQYIYNKLLSLDKFNSRDSTEQERRYRILNCLRYLKGYSTTPFFWNHSYKP